MSCDRSTSRSLPLDAKREEFRKWLEKEGIIEVLTNMLGQLHHKRPKSAMEFVRETMTDMSALQLELNTEMDKNNLMQKKCMELSMRVLLLEQENRVLRNTIMATTSCQETDGDSPPASAAVSD